MIEYNFGKHTITIIDNAIFRSININAEVHGGNRFCLKATRLVSAIVITVTTMVI